MSTELCKLPQYYQAIIILLVLLFEAWLGKTALTKSASILELVLRPLWAIVKWFTKPKGGNDETVGP